MYKLNPLPKQITPEEPSAEQRLTQLRHAKVVYEKRQQYILDVLELCKQLAQDDYILYEDLDNLSSRAKAMGYDYARLLSEVNSELTSLEAKLGTPPVVKSKPSRKPAPNALPAPPVLLQDQPVKRRGRPPATSKLPPVPTL